MKPSPGTPSPQEGLVGRAALIEEMWRLLTHASLVLLGPRRIGKTSLLHALSTQGRPGFRVHYIAASGARSVAEFHDRLHAAVWSHESGYARKLAHAFSHAKVQLGMAPEPTHEIERVFRETALAEESIAVIIFDDFTEFLEHLPEQTADRFLSVLRHMRMEFRNLRMVFADERLSVVMNRRGVSNAINDMHVVVIPELPMADGVLLATELLTGSGLKFEPAVPRRIAEMAGGVPHHIHLLAAELHRDHPAEPIGEPEVDRVMARLLDDPLDRLSLNHLERRISEYAGREGKVVRRLLTRLAAHPEQRIPLDEISEPGELRVIKELWRDGILAQDPAGDFKFRNALISTWAKRSALDPAKD